MPTRLAYFIEALPGTCVPTHGVKDPSAPYTLFAWAGAYFGDAPGALALSRTMMEISEDYGDEITVGMENYPWPNYKHFLVTNTSGTTGAAADVDDSQYWNTNAKDDGSGILVAYANFAGKPDTRKATEARFPDGDYIVHIIADDLIQTAGPFLEWTVRLENFNPIVCDTDPPLGAVLPAGTDELGGATVVFNEAMDTTVSAASIMAVDNGATITGAMWINPFTIGFDLHDMVNGQAYELRVKALAKDQAGTPGNRPLDGNKNGVGGDDFTTTFSVALP